MNYSYEGQWVNGKQHGLGKYTSIKKITKSGQWNQGKRISWINDQ